MNANSSTIAAPRPAPREVHTVSMIQGGVRPTPSPRTPYAAEAPSTRPRPASTIAGPTYVSGYDCDIDAT